MCTAVVRRIRVTGLLLFTSCSSWTAQTTPLSRDPHALPKGDVRLRLTSGDTYDVRDVYLRSDSVFAIGYERDRDLPVVYAWPASVVASVEHRQYDKTKTVWAITSSTLLVGVTAFVVGNAIAHLKLE